MRYIGNYSRTKTGHRTFKRSFYDNYATDHLTKVLFSLNYFNDLVIENAFRRQGCNCMNLIHPVSLIILFN